MWSLCVCVHAHVWVCKRLCIAAIGHTYIFTGFSYILPLPHKEATIKVLRFDLRKAPGSLYLKREPCFTFSMPSTDVGAQTNTWQAVCKSLRFCLSRGAVTLHQINTTQQITLWHATGNFWKYALPALGPRLPSPACAAAFKLTILKLLKRAWQVIYSVAEDSNFTVQRQCIPTASENPSTQGTQV